MDLLADLLQQAGLRRRLLERRHIAAGTAVRFPCDRSLGLHVITRGSLFLHAPALAQPLQLHAGDIALMSRGCDHLLSPEAVITRRTPVHTATPWTGATLAGDAADAADAGTESSSGTAISGAYQFWNPPVHPFFSEIPDWFVLRADAQSRMAPLSLCVAMLGDELQQRQLGSEIVVHGLLDVVFTSALRELLRQHGEAAGAASWSHAVGDPQIRTVLALMHESCAHPWTLDELAQRAGLSRTSLAERFRQTLGDTPLNHLRTLRMQRAMQALSDSECTLEQVAQQVGYIDAFSFSKVFKRTVGVSPREFRQRDRQDQQLPRRFKAG